MEIFALDVIDRDLIPTELRGDWLDNTSEFVRIWEISSSDSCAGSGKPAP